MSKTKWAYIAPVMQTVLLASIITPDYLLRTHKDEDVQDLASDLETNGIDNPVCVIDNGDGSYTLNDGAQRFTASEVLASRDGSIAGLEVGEVKVSILGHVDNWPIERQICNMIRLNASIEITSPKSYYNSVIRLGNMGMSAQEIANENSKPVAAVRNWLKAFNLPVAVRDAVVNGDITLQNALALSNNKKELGGDTVVEALLDQAINEDGKTFADTVANIVNENKAAEKAPTTGESAPSKEFELTPKALRGKDLLELMETIILENDENPSDASATAVNTIKRVFQIDDVSAVARKQKFDDDAEAKRIKAEQAKADKIVESTGMKVVEFIDENGRDAFDELVDHSREVKSKREAEKAQKESEAESLEV